MPRQKHKHDAESNFSVYFWVAVDTCPLTLPEMLFKLGFETLHDQSLHQALHVHTSFGDLDLTAREESETQRTVILLFLQFRVQVMCGLAQLVQVASWYTCYHQVCSFILMLLMF